MVMKLEDTLSHLGEIAMKDVLIHISERLWSSYTTSDYSLKQWHAACLIHLHGDGSYSKGDCKLPVRTPGGALNRNGVHAAAAALAGARGGVIASPEQKTSAARSLIKFYKELNEEPPSSLLKHSYDLDDFLMHFGAKGMRWGVRKDERALNDRDKSLNISQRSQVKVASTISALAAVGMSTNAAATIFQLQSRFERLQVAKEIIKATENNPFINDAARSGLKTTQNNIIKGIVGSALATTAVSVAIGVVTQRTAKAYFAPMHKVYGDAKPKINSDLRKLSKDIKNGNHPHMTVKAYNTEVSKIVQKHMTSDKKNLLFPFHELARSQLGLQYNTKNLDIKFTKLPNTNLYDKMTVITPDGLKLIKAIKKVEHADMSDSDDSLGDLDFFFDYKFDSEGFIEEWSCPTIEIANDMINDRFDLEAITEKFGGKTITHTETDEEGFIVDLKISELDSMTQSDLVDDFLAHFGTKGMRWGVIGGAIGTGARATGTAARATGRAGLATGRATRTTGRVIGKTREALGGPSRDALKAKATAKAIKRGGLLNASDADLKHLVERLNLEKRYSEVTAKPSKATRVNKTVKNLLGYGQTFKKASDFADSGHGRNLLGTVLKGGRHSRLFPDNPLTNEAYKHIKGYSP